MFPEFEVVPAVDLQDGQVVQLVGGKRNSGTSYGDPVEAARQWIGAGAETLHLVDLGGAFEGRRQNAEAIEEIVTVCAGDGPSGDGGTADTVDVQLGGGIRTAAEATGLLERGVDRVILGTAAVENPDIVREVAEPGRVMVSLDASDGEVVVSGWTEETGLDPAAAAGRYEDLGAGAILFTDVDVEGRMEGVRTGPVARVVEAVDIPVVASGGVATLADVRALRDAGAAAVVVGTALYEGGFTLSDAKEL
jgi:phosphoribosylformimino-5-aminoimidazole carboxamide ribotide isomerase